MICVLEGNGVKVFGKAVHALARVGETLWLDPGVKGLALRSVDAAHSAYACFLFSPLFFQHYSVTSGSAIQCKLLMKSVLPLFRCLTSIERSVERCRISITDRSDQVEIQFFCRHGLTKTHSFRFQESEALQAVFASHLCPNVLKAPARLLSDMVKHFPVSQEEITLSTTHLKVSLRNYYERGNGHLKMMCTEMSLHPDEFDYIQVGVESDITFCLKELRGFLSFAESHCLQVSIYFGTAGKPVCFSVEDMVLEATVVLATLIDSDSRSSSQLNETQAPTTTRCADAGLPEADSSKAFNAAGVMEHIASSQGSPTINPPCLMQLLPQICDPDELCALGKACDSANTTPASTMAWILYSLDRLRGAVRYQCFKCTGKYARVHNVPLYEICSLLFRALSSEADAEGCTSTLPALACYSDTEDDMADCTRSPSL